MRDVLRYTLVADGSSDACLKWVIDWLLLNDPDSMVSAFEGVVADFRPLHNPPRALAGRIAKAHTLFPCDLMFVHRDAETQPMESRLEEIRQCLPPHAAFPHVPLVPVRMTEAWLLIDEGAIRRAADNPNGAMSLEMPRIDELERIPQPKKLLRKLLIRASGKRGRNKRRFEARIPERVHRVAGLIEDFSPLMALPAFAAFRQRTQTALATLA